jgi:DUF4097 and DUF4098 domain-containing protein YvlB
MAGYPPPYPPPGPPYGNDWKYQRRMMKDQARAQRDILRAQREAYRSQLRGMRRGSIVGPILVVTLGIIFLLVQTGRLQSYALWSWYSRWWPIVIVGVGIILLLEWVFDQNARRNQQPPYYRRSVGGGIIFLLVLLIATGIGFRAFSEGHGFFPRGFIPNTDDIDQFLGDKHESDQTIDQAFPANASLNISNPRGDITVSGTSDDNQIHITLHKEVYTRSDSAAETKAQQLTPQTSTTDNVVNLSLPMSQGAHADMVVTVPGTTPVTVTANHGDVYVNTVKAPVNVTANHGDVELSAITGTAVTHINNGGSSFSAHSITGPVTIEGHGHDLTISDITGPLSFTGELFGTTHLEHIRGPVRFHTMRTDFQLARVDGEVDISPRDELTADAILGPVVLTTRSRNITLERIAGNVSVTNSNGSVDLTAAAPLGNVTVENRHGDINLTVPDQATFTVQAQTTNGDLNNEFSLPTEGTDTHKNFGGTVGKGGPLFRLTTSEGDINLKKASIAPIPLAPPPPPAPPTPLSIHDSDGNSIIIGKNGLSITSSPDGSRIIVGKDGTRITKGPDGSNAIVKKDGSRYTSTPDGTRVYAGKDGVRVTSTPNGSLVYSRPDGTKYTSGPDGTKVYIGKDGTRIRINPDGTRSATGPNGKQLNDNEIQDRLSKVEAEARRELDRHQSATTTNF